MNLKESIVFLKSNREFQYTRPNKGFFSQLLAYELELFGENSLAQSDYRRVF
jgi:hypothetical protein